MAEIYETHVGQWVKNQPYSITRLFSPCQMHKLSLVHCANFSQKSLFNFKRLLQTWIYTLRYQYNTTWKVSCSDEPKIISNEHQAWYYVLFELLFFVCLLEGYQREARRKSTWKAALCFTCYLLDFQDNRFLVVHIFFLPLDIKRTSPVFQSLVCVLLLLYNYSMILMCVYRCTLRCFICPDFFRFSCWEFWSCVWP